MKQINQILARQFKHQFGRVTTIFILIITGVGMNAVTPLLYKLLIDNVLGDEPLDTSLPIIGNFLAQFDTQQELGFFVVAAYLITSVISSLMDYAHLYTTRVVILNAIYELSEVTYRNLQQFNIGFFRRVDIGDYIYRLSTDVDTIGDLVVILISIITSSLFLIITTIIMLLISVELTLISFITIPFLLAALVIFNKRLVRTTKRSELTNSMLFSFMQQALKQLKTIQAYSQEKYMANEFNRVQREQLSAEKELEKVDYTYDLVIGIAMAIIYTTIFAYGIQGVFSGELTVGLLLVFTYYLDNLTNPMLDLADNVYDFKLAYTKIARLEEFFNTKSLIEDTGTITEVQNNELAFQNVTLMGEEDFVILNDITCKIPANKITIIAGISGSGKTSFISLIPRLIKSPTGGHVLLGNLDITMYPINVLRDKIAFVAQENELFNHSIKDIIAFGKPNATYDEIQRAAQLACADEFIYKHHQGYSFKVGEGGNYLSGGQRQRLMLARAFLKDSDIMIFDEPFSNLDQDTKRKVWHNIKKVSHKKTVIIVSNILDFISEADYLILLNNGVIKYEGIYEGLKHKKDLAKLLLEDV